MVRVPALLRDAVARHPTVRKALLGCGVAGSALLAVADALGALRFPGYSVIYRSASDLSAVGSPTRPLVVPLNLTADALLVAFGAGIWALAGRNRALRLTAAFVIGNAVISAVVAPFFPMHLGDEVSTSRDATSVVLSATGMFAFLLAIASGAVALRGRFRSYSVGTLAAYLVLTIVGLRLGASPAGSSGHAAPVGAQERTMIYSYLLWLVLLAAVLLRTQRANAAMCPERPGLTPPGTPSSRDRVTV